MVGIRLGQGAPVRQDLPADYNAVIAVLEGEGAIGVEGKIETSADVAGLTRGDTGRHPQWRSERRTNHCGLYSMPAVHCMRRRRARSLCHEHRGRD